MYYNCFGYVTSLFHIPSFYEAFTYEKEKKEWNEKFEKEKKEWNKNFEKEKKEWNEKFEKERRERNKEYGKLIRKIGSLVEDIIAPGTYAMLEKYFNISRNDIIDFGIRRVIKNEKKETLIEIDILAITTKTAFFIEVKSNPDSDDIKDYVKKLEKAKSNMKQFSFLSDKELIPLFASFNMYNKDNIVKYATRNKVYVVVYNEDDYLEIINFDDISYA